VPLIGLRRKIAEKMQDAKRRIPHFTYVEEVDVTEVDALRTELNTRFAERGRLTLLPLLMRAIVLSVRTFPQVNARFDDDAGVVTRFNAVHIGIATQTEPGLMVPVVRNAEARDLWASAAEVARRPTPPAMQGAARAIIWPHPPSPAGAGASSPRRSSSWGCRRRQLDGRAAGDSRQRSRAQDDEPVVLVRPPRHRRHGGCTAMIRGYLKAPTCSWSACNLHTTLASAAAQAATSPRSAPRSWACRRSWSKANTSAAPA
jgi:hypothetical protein